MEHKPLMAITKSIKFQINCFCHCFDCFAYHNFKMKLVVLYQPHPIKSNNGMNLLLALIFY